MRTKLYLGLLVMAIVGIGAGERVFNRLCGAQDAQNAQKTVEAPKKDAVPVIPSLPTVKDDKFVIPAPAPITIEPPSLAPFKTGEPQDLPKPAVLGHPPMKPVAAPPAAPTGPKPAVGEDTKADPLRYETPGYPKAAFDTPVDPKKVDKDLPAVSLPPTKPVIPSFNPVFPSSAVPAALTSPAPTSPGVSGDGPLTLTGVKPSGPQTGLPSSPLKPDPKTTELPTVPVAPIVPIGQQVAGLKNSPWSLRIDMIDGQTIVTGTVNHKHTFKLICQNLELNTGKDLLKASGKVAISGDTLTGNCETLGIVLTDDRLILEGGVEVRILKAATNGSDTKPASFELKGETLNLRISELQSAKLAQSTLQQVSNSSAIPVRPATKTTPAQGGQWTQWGVLRRTEEKAKNVGETVWRLEDARGTSLVLLVARDGGTLAQYEGQRISVYGATEQIAGESVLRVSHIALP